LILLETVARGRHIVEFENSGSVVVEALKSLCSERESHGTVWSGTIPLRIKGEAIDVGVLCVQKRRGIRAELSVTKKWRS
jgi:hypothetical protein